MAGGGVGGLRAGIGRRGLPLTADINVVSLIDVAFVLLIIFMITAPLMQGGVEVQLPRAVTRPLQSPEALVVTVDARGRVFVDREEMSYEEFRGAFRAIVTQRRATAAYLRADTRASYGNVVRVLAVMRLAGVQDVGLITEEEPR
jgi:biopolymer transport protein ExbD/biopolymer transport protein TolR